MGGMRKIWSCELQHLPYSFSEIVRFAVVRLQSGIRCISLKNVGHKDTGKSITDVFPFLKNTFCLKIIYNQLLR
jgi:hypothetical protein